MQSGQWSNENPQAIALGATRSTHKASWERVGGGISEGRATGCGGRFGQTCGGNAADIQRLWPPKRKHRLRVAELDGAVGGPDEVEPPVERWRCAQGYLT